jgi:hypothetical protein
MRERQKTRPTALGDARDIVCRAPTVVLCATIWELRAVHNVAALVAGKLLGFPSLSNHSSTLVLN